MGFGNDYPTHGRTCVVDYVHLVDLDNGHVSALKAIENRCGIEIYNMGTRYGYSVLDIVNALVQVNGVEVLYSIKLRRAGG